MWRRASSKYLRQTPTERLFCMIQSILPVFQLFLSFANICIVIYAFFKFINKPHDSLESRVSTIEVKVEEIMRSLQLGNDRFSRQKDTNEVLIRSTLALVEFEIQYCLTEHKDMSKGLEKAKEDLNSYLSKI